MSKTTRLLAFVYCLVTASAYTTPSPPNKSFAFAKAAGRAATAGATAALAVFLTTAEPALATSKTAAQIELNSIPPSSIQINIQDLPVVGSLISGTYTKTSENIANPSVVIRSPKDKIGAIKGAAIGGHLEADVSGKLATHLDVDFVADEAGVARVRVASPLIPKLPIKNSAASGGPTYSGKGSDWYFVTNMGNGETYYWNQATGDTTVQKPAGI